MTYEQRVKENRQAAKELADRLAPHFSGLTMEVAMQAIGFLTKKLEHNFRHNTPLIIKEDD